MKILLVTSEGPRTTGGISTFLQGLYSGLQEIGHHVVCLTGSQEGKQGFNTISWYNGSARSFKLSKAPLYRSLAQHLLHNFDFSEFDEIIMCDYASLLVFSNYLCDHNTPYVAIAHGTDFLKAKDPKGTLIRLISGCLNPYLNAKHIFFNSEFTRSKFNFFTNGIPLSILSMGIDDWWCAQTPKNNTKDIDSNLIDIITVGRLVERKRQLNIARSIISFNTTTTNRIRFRYKIIGSGYNDEYEKRTKQLAAQCSEVCHLGELSRDDIFQNYCNSDVFVMPASATASDIEGFGLVYLEAAAAGLPSIGSQSSGATSAILDGITGFTVGDNLCHNTDKLLPFIIDQLPALRSMSDGCRNWARAHRWRECARSVLSQLANTH